MSITTDPTDPRLGRGGNDEPVPQNEVYLVLTEERAKGFIRPVRDSYVHEGIAGPQYELRDLTEEEKANFGDTYVKYEIYPESMHPKRGKMWSQKELDSIGGGCKTTTTMNRAIAETYARNPTFYGYTYCCACQKHLPLKEFRWKDGEVVGS